MQVRDRILGAALRLLAESGAHELTQPKVARAAGVRQSHLTYYFPTRTDLLQEVARLLLVEQNVAVSLKISNRAYVLENGRIVMSGLGAELLHNDRVRQAYLGL